MIMRRWLIVAGMLLGLTACPKPTPNPPPPECTAGTSDCQCNTDGTCGTGLRCTNAKCELCPLGEMGCGCGTGDTCGTGLACQGSVCVTPTCTAGTEHCPCGTGNTCTGALQCRQNVCTACAADAVGCACGTGNTCMTGLACDATSHNCRLPRDCAAVACSAHQTCQAATSTADAQCLMACDSGYRWDNTTGTCIPIATCQAGVPGSISQTCSDQHRDCVNGTGGADATCATDCQVGFLEENGACRAVLTCMTVNDACVAQNRECTAAGDHTDAECGACLTGFQLNMGTCEAIPTANCNPGAAGSILATCQADNRACDTTATGAMCGACITGFVDMGGSCLSEQTCEMLGCAALGRQCMNIPRDGGPPVATGCGGCLSGLVPSSSTPGSQCRVPLTCADVASTCTSSQYCEDGMGTADATCKANPCADGSAQTTVGTTRCVQCLGSCTEAGQTGRFWPFTDLNSTNCICETRDGYYAETGNAAGAPQCDVDGDGFVTISARDYVNSVDPHIRTNARCHVRTIDRIALRNEFEQEREVMLCMGNDVVVGGSCPTPQPIQLYESQTTDDDGELLDEPLLIEYGMGSRRLRAAEINPFTKACLSRVADFNQNGQPDLLEWHGMTAAMDTFTRYSYFLELHHGRFEPSATGAAFGRWVIEEKSRCDPDFPLAYTATEGQYWQQCTRRQDKSFDATGLSPNVNEDFAEWGCSSSQNAPMGNCSTPPPVPMYPTGAAIPPHGLCQVQGMLPPTDGIWRGMNHHSQFKCVSISSTPPVDPAEQDAFVLRTQLYNNDMSLLQFNRCSVACPAADPTCAADCSTGTCTTSSVPPTGIANPSEPKLSCQTVLAPNANTTETGFVAVRFNKTGAYTNGCINEFNEPSFLDLCPGHHANPTPGVISGEGDQNNFGSLVCGCGSHYGGPLCDEGCPDMNLFLQSGYRGEDRKGYWMCAQPTTVSGTLTSDGGPGGSSYTLRGTTPIAVTPTTMLCQGAGCDGGYRLR